ncbi:hypothetical protein CVT25_014465 [Psilocybe cyanescens]|uniref:Uncharacterized protein n=1 Tax=Psilocybe cyanescens TaxID=93625 RepID=A0A409XRM0_PSICY|nr:hypothetical protein CVT25_014465 [Psilocybe cyanescens]
MKYAYKRLLTSLGILRAQSTKSQPHTVLTHPHLANYIEYGKPLDNTPYIPHLQTDATSEDWRTDCSVD